MKRSNMITIGLSSFLLISIIGNVVLFNKIENETNESATIENKLTALKDTYIQAQLDVSDIEQKITEVKMSNNSADNAQEVTNNAEIIIPIDPNFKLKSGKTLYEVRVIIDEQQKLFESEGYDKEYVNKLLAQISDEFGVPIETVHQIKLDDEEQNTVEIVNTGGNNGSTGGNTQTTPYPKTEWDKNGNGLDDQLEEYGDGSVGGGKTTSDDDFQLGMPGDTQTTPNSNDKNGNGINDAFEVNGGGQLGNNGGSTTSDDDFQLGMPEGTDGQP